MTRFARTGEPTLRRSLIPLAERAIRLLQAGFEAGRTKLGASRRFPTSQATWEAFATLRGGHPGLSSWLDRAGRILEDQFRPRGPRPSGTRFNEAGA